MVSNRLSSSIWRCFHNIGVNEKWIPDNKHMPTWIWIANDIYQSQGEETGPESEESDDFVINII